MGLAGFPGAAGALGEAMCCELQPAGLGRWAGEHAPCFLLNRLGGQLQPAKGCWRRRPDSSLCSGAFEVGSRREWAKCGLLLGVRAGVGGT